MPPSRASERTARGMRAWEQVEAWAKAAALDPDMQRYVKITARPPSRDYPRFGSSGPKWSAYADLILAVTDAYDLDDNIVQDEWDEGATAPEDAITQAYNVILACLEQEGYDVHEQRAKPPKRLLG